MLNTEVVKFDHLGARITEMIAPLKGMVVRNPTENAAAKGALITVKALSKEIEALRTVAVAPYLEANRQINARAKELTEPLDRAEAEIKRVMAAFAKAEQDRIAAEKRAADEKAAAERKRLEDERLAREKREREEKEARDRQERERVAQEERDRKAAEAFGIDLNATDKEAEEEQVRHKMEREAADQLAEENRKAALRREKAEEERIEKNRKMEERRFAASAPKNLTTQWKFEVTERLEVPMEYWSIDESKIGQAVRGGAREIPGVKIWSEQAVVAR